VRLQLDDTIECFDRPCRIVLLLSCQAQVHQALREVRRNIKRALEQSFCVAPLFGAHGNAREQPQCVDVGWVSQQHVTIDLLGFAYVPHTLQTQSANECFAVWRQFEGLFELDRRVIVFTQPCQDLRFLQANRPTAGLELFCSLQRLERFLQATLHDQ